MGRVDISIIIPAYNEEKRIGSYLAEIQKYLAKSKISAEIIVIDDGSKDKTASVARKFGVKVYTNKPNRGKGYSVKRGMLLGKGKYLLFTDADGATPIKELGRFLKLAEQGGYEVLVGSRSIRGAKLAKKQPFYRVFLGKGFFLLTVTILGIWYYDTQCGFKLFSKRAARQIFAKQTIERFGFDPEILFIAKKYKFKSKEVPVSWHDVAGSKVNPVRESVKMFFELLKIRWNWVKGKY